MGIIISDEEIREIVKNEVDKSVRKRIKEMQGDYTSKGYLEDIMRDVIWNTICDKIPRIEEYIKSEISRCIDYKKKISENINKRQLINSVVDAFLENME